MIIKDGNNIIINAPQELTIRTVKEFASELIGTMPDEYEGILANLIGTTEIDSAGLQLLISIKNESTQKSKNFNVVGMSTEVDEIVSLYGLGNFF